MSILRTRCEITKYYLYRTLGDFYYIGRDNDATLFYLQARQIRIIGNGRHGIYIQRFEFTKR